MSVLRFYWSISFIIIAVILKDINSKPIEVTGKNIKYYKSTPNEGSGSYNFNFGTSDGAERSEHGYVKHEPGSNNPLLVVAGSFKYPDPKGEVFEVFYVADENGYRIVPKEEVAKISEKYEITPIEQKAVSNNQKGDHSPKQQDELLKKQQEEHAKKQQEEHTKKQLEEHSKKQEEEHPKEKQEHPKKQEEEHPKEKQEHPKSLGKEQPNDQQKVTTPKQVFPNEVVIKSKSGESSIIGVKLVKASPVRKPFECPPGKCSGARQSKVFVIKPTQIS